MNRDYTIYRPSPHFTKTIGIWRFVYVESVLCEERSVLTLSALFGPRL